MTAPRHRIRDNFEALQAIELRGDVERPARGIDIAAVRIIEAEALIRAIENNGLLPTLVLTIERPASEGLTSLGAAPALVELAGRRLMAKGPPWRTLASRSDSVATPNEEACSQSAAS